jgi:hypothetical protein
MPHPSTKHSCRHAPPGDNSAAGLSAGLCVTPGGTDPGIEFFLIDKKARREDCTTMQLLGQPMIFIAKADDNAC